MVERTLNAEVSFMDNITTATGNINEMDWEEIVSFLVEEEDYEAEPFG